MKKLWVMSIVAIVLLLPLSTQAQTALGNGITGIKKIVLTNDAGQNLIEFISTAPLEDIHGTATGISGTIQLNADHLEKTTGHIRVEVRSMETGIKKRNRHLYSDEWLDAEKYPTIDFHLRKLEQIKIVEQTSQKVVFQGYAVGDFSLHGVTKEMKIPFKMTYLKESPETRKRTSGDLVLIEGEFDVSLKDFNIKGRRGIIGKRVGESIHIKARFFGATR